MPLKMDAPSLGLPESGPRTVALGPSAALLRGIAGSVSDRTGYRYDRSDPETGRPWPDMPYAFGRLAADAAEQAGFPGFAPDACLINRYVPGARLTLHQDKNERDFGQPIVSVS